LVRAAAIPAEHGGWGFLLEPLLLGLLVAWSWQGLWLAIAATGIFLVHQPLKIALRDHRKGRRSARTIWCERFAVSYGLMAVAPFLFLLATQPPRFMLPILVALPLALTQIVFDARSQSKTLTAELAGAVALGASASSIAILDGWATGGALCLWVILIARAAPSILYVRARLRAETGREYEPAPVWLAHGAALIAIAVLAAYGAVPWLSVAAIALLLVRAVVGLSRYRRPQRAARVGIMEMVYGAMVVGLSALGYAFS
jgi:1,4-dihydroxy-2-naphthoate octaprenyltransferase